LKKVLYLIIASLLVMGLVLAGCPSGNGVEDQTVTIAAIPGVTPPATGATPKATITDTAQYTGAISWAPADSPFKADTIYTATITLTAKSGFTLAGVAANFFTVAGATASNAAGSGTVQAVFPATLPEAATIIKIGVAGDMSVPHGVNMMQGAQLAIDQIGPFTVGANTYVFQLVEMNTADLSGDIAATKLAVEAKIADVNYVIGGFRTEHTTVMQEVICEDNGKLFLGLGAGGVGLTSKVQADFDNYKYFFRLLPINDFFLVTSAFKIVQSVILTLLQDPNLPFETMADINVYILAEQAEWATPAVQMAEGMLLPALGVNHVGTARPSDRAAAGDLSATIADMAAKDTHVVMTIMAGTVGFSWAAARAGAGLPVISAGINAMAHMTAFAQLGAAALGEITLDTTARDVQLSSTTQPFLNAFIAKHNAYPLYTGCSAYDSMYLLKAAIQQTGSLSSADIAAAIPGLDLPAVSGKMAFYPRAAIDLGSVQPGLRALSAAQAYALYGDHLLAFYEEPNFAGLEANWLAKNYVAQWTSPPHLPQDIAYGPAIGNTAVASQWQGTAAAPIKVAVWPRQHAPAGTPVATLKAMGLFDKWGNWNFQFAGTQPLFIPQAFYDKWG